MLKVSCKRRVYEPKAESVEKRAGCVKMIAFKEIRLKQ